MDLAMNQLGRLLGDADLGEEQSFELYGKVLDILNGEGETPAQTTDGLQQNDTGTMVNAGENIETEAAVQQLSLIHIYVRRRKRRTGQIRRERQMVPVRRKIQKRHRMRIK